MYLTALLIISAMILKEEGYVNSLDVTDSITAEEGFGLECATHVPRTTNHMGDFTRQQLLSAIQWEWGKAMTCRKMERMASLDSKVISSTPRPVSSFARSGEMVLSRQYGVYHGLRVRRKGLE